MTTPDRMVTVSADDLRAKVARIITDSQYPGNGWPTPPPWCFDGADAVLAALASVPEEHPEQSPTDHCPTCHSDQWWRYQRGCQSPQTGDPWHRRDDPYWPPRGAL